MFDITASDSGWVPLAPLWLLVCEVLQQQAVPLKCYFTLMLSHRIPESALQRTGSIICATFMYSLTVLVTQFMLFGTCVLFVSSKYIMLSPLFWGCS